MKQYTTAKRLHLRLMRTLTNKYAETFEPRFRRAFKAACNDNKEFSQQIEALVKNMDSIFVGAVQKITVAGLSPKPSEAEEKNE